MTFLVKDLATAVEVLIEVFIHARESLDDYSLKPNVPSGIVKEGLTVIGIPDGLKERLLSIPGVIVQ